MCCALWLFISTSTICVLEDGKKKKKLTTRVKSVLGGKRLGRWKQKGPEFLSGVLPSPLIPQSWSIDFQLDPHYHEPFAAPTWQVDMKKGLLDPRQSTGGSRQMSSARGDQPWQDASSFSLGHQNALYTDNFPQWFTWVVIST